jgi:hypothetical protein
VLLDGVPQVDLGINSVSVAPALFLNCYNANGSQIFYHAEHCPFSDANTQRRLSDCQGWVFRKADQYVRMVR